MRKWTYERLKTFLDEFEGEHDPSDPKTRKRQRIIEAATELFIKHGYRRTSVEDVARRSGVAKGTVYLYFSTKVDLLVHAIVAEKKRYFEHLVPVLADEVPPRERLRRWLELAFVLATKMPLTSRLLGPDRDMRLAAEEWMATEDSGVWSALRVDFIAEMIEEAVAPRILSPKDLADRATVLFGLVYSGLVTDETIRGGLTADRYGELLASIVLEGIGFPLEADSGDPNEPA